MGRRMPQLDAFIQLLENPAGPIIPRSMGQSFKIDVGLNRSPQRWRAFRDQLNAAHPGSISVADGLERHRDWLKAFINTATDAPSTFDPSLNQPALISPSDRERVLVRLEEVNWVCKNPEARIRHECDPAGLNGFFKELGHENLSLRQNAENKVDGFFREWNKLRDQRPTFAAFYDEIAADADAPDWLERLRARLGLGHIGPDGGDSQLVLQMRYKVGDVLDGLPKAQRDHAFAIPTLLDISLNPYFFPAPPGINSGKALDLMERPISEHRAAEVLHRRLTYRPAHVAKFTLVSKAARPDLRARRNEHLESVRREAAAPGFGYVLF
jgi:hypothetical protein